MRKRNKQSIQLTFRIILLILVLVLSMAVMAQLLSSRQTSLYLNSYTEDISNEFDELPELLEWSEEEVARNTSNFDQTYLSLAQSIAYMAENDTGFAVFHGKMVEYQEMLNVDNVMIVSREGEIQARATATQADFTSSRFNQLRTVFYYEIPENPIVEINSETKDWNMRYYAARIDDDTMVVIEENPSELLELLEDYGSTRSVVEDMTLSSNGYVFTVSSRDYLIEYHPDETLIGEDAIDAGIDVSALKDGTYSWITLNGESLYCGVRKFGDLYYVAAVPRSDMTSTRNITVAVILFAFLAVMLIVILYGVFVMRDNDRKGTDPKDVIQKGNFRFNRIIVTKSAVLSFVGFLAILVVSFFMQTLFALSSQSVMNLKRVENILEGNDRTNERAAELVTEYGERYLPICETIGYILDENKDLANQNDLQHMADMLDVHSILVYESNGELYATNLTYTNYSITADSDDSSYEFVKLLQGVTDYVVQDPIRDDVTGDLWQYIGVPLHNEEGYVDGLVQIAIQPTILEAYLDTTDFDYILGGIKLGSGGFAFSIDKADNTFAYYPPNERYVGESVFEHGIKESQLKNNYSNYLTIDGDTYYSASGETENYYVYLVTDTGELMNERVPLTMTCGAVALVCLIIIFLLMIFEPGHNLEPPDESEEDDDDIDLNMPNGERMRTNSVASRWINNSLKWNEKSAWQKTVTILRWLIGLMVVIVALAVLFKDSIFSSESIFYYILSNEWERGLNIFALTACVMFICVALTLVSMARRLLNLLATVLSARGVTICRLLNSFIKYATIIGMTYYSLLLIGINGTTLLASAGILSIAISFGATQLVSDIISGLFIIFEGDFRVGDIIMVGDWRGTVLEIGVRTTKIEDPSQNVKVIRNSDVSNIINMTKRLSFLSCDFSIEYGESLERVESILAEELPKMPERLPAIKVGPFYRGVSELGDNSVNIRIVMQCEEGDRVQLGRDVNREMKLLFDKYNINIPFPQIVINEPTEFKEATEKQQQEAEEFMQEQKKAAKGLGGDSENE